MGLGVFEGIAVVNHKQYLWLFMTVWQSKILRRVSRRAKTKTSNYKFSVRTTNADAARKPPSMECISSLSRSLADSN